MSFSNCGELTPLPQCHSGIWCLCLAFERAGQRAECDPGLWSEATGSLIFLFPDSLGVGSRAVVGRDPVLMILHMKIFQGGTEERPKEKKERTSQTAGWDGKGENGRDNGDGLLLVNILMLWDDVPCERDFVGGKAVLGSPSPCVCSVSPAVCVLPVLLLQEWREKVPCGNRQLHVGFYSVSPMYDGNVRRGCVIWGLCWCVLLSHFCYKQRAAGQEGTLSCLIWPQGWVRSLQTFPADVCPKQLLKASSDGLSSSSLGDPRKSVIVLAITKIFLVSDFDFCAALENCCPLALLLLYRVSCSVPWSCLWESLVRVFLGLQRAKLPWRAVSDTCMYWASKQHFVTLK